MEFPFAIVQPYLTKGAPSYKLVLATWPTKEEMARVKEFAQVGSSEMKPCLTILATYPSDESVMVDLMSEMSEKYKAERVMSKGAICY